ncbi:MAG: phosphatase PAP2 family protein [Clostridiales bacterium]|nr:phosphatase PAP2 family protein [Clostridiales bacterium]
MNKILSPKGITCIIAIFIVILGLTLGAFFDLDISKALAISETDGTLALRVHPISSIILTVIGYFLPFVFIGFSAAVITLNLLRKKEKMKTMEKLICVVLFLGVIACMAYIAYETMDTISTTKFGFWHYLMMALMIFVMTFLIWYVAINLNPVVVKKSYVPAIITVVSYGAALAFAEAAKLIWGRIRPRELVELGSFDGFVNWYQVSGLTGHKSFPSGHSVEAILMLLVILWMTALGASKKAKKITTIGILCWTALMMFSRILAGAHFLSDVTAGFAIGFAFLYIAFVMYERKTGKSLYLDA